MLFENPAVAAKLPFPYTVPPPMQAATAVPQLSATIENGTLISHDLHNALAVIKNEQVISQQQQQQQQQQQPQNAAIAVASTATTTTINNGTTTASHSGSSGRSTPNNTDSAPGKLFVGGLSWQTSADKLKEYFGMFGNVTDVLIMKDPVTQRSRGFGFITFSEPSSVENVLKVPIHTLDGKKIDPKHATPKNRPKQSNKTKKIFVGGVSQDTSSDEVKAYFNQFGKVEETVMLMDQQTKRHRGFGFVTFENEDVVDRVCEIHFHTIKNKKVECKKAQPKESVAPTAQLLQKRFMLGGLGVRMVPQTQMSQMSQMTQMSQMGQMAGPVAAASAINPTQLQVVQAQAQAAQVAALQAQQNAAAANFGKVFSAYPPLHSFRYAPYPMPTGAASAATGHPHAGATSSAAVAPQTAHVQQQPQQTHQPPGMAQAQAATAQMAQPFPYGIPNVDMSSFQNVDWSNIYGMYV